MSILKESICFPWIDNRALAKEATVVYEPLIKLLSVERPAIVHLRVDIVELNLGQLIASRGEHIWQVSDTYTAALHYLKVIYLPHY